jgi:hypothetical protein
LRWEQLLVGFLFWLPSAHPSSAQQSANPPSAVIGIVRTSEGTPVPGATVRLIDTVTNKVWMSWTDQTGKFEFPQIADGKYRIEASQLGFVQSSLVVEVPIVPPGPVPVVLRVATLAELSAKQAGSWSEPREFRECSRLELSGLWERTRRQRTIAGGSDQCNQCRPGRGRFRTDRIDGRRNKSASNGNERLRERRASGRTRAFGRQ